MSTVKWILGYKTGKLVSKPSNSWFVSSLFVSLLPFSYYDNKRNPVLQMVHAISISQGFLGNRESLLSWDGYVVWMINIYCVKQLGVQSWLSRYNLAYIDRTIMYNTYYVIKFLRSPIVKGLLLPFHNLNVFNYRNHFFF